MRVLIPALLIVSGCVAWTPTPVGPAQTIRENSPELVRITRNTGEQITLYGPELRGDSITGMEDREPLPWVAPASVALSDIRHIETREPAPERSIWGLLLVVIGLFILGDATTTSVLEGG